MDRAGKAVNQWVQEMPDLDLLPMEVIGRLSEAALLIRRGRLEPLFASFGLQPGEFDVLATLRRSGHPYTLTPTALYDAAMMSSGGMTNRLDRLEKTGLIERRPNPADRRGTLVSLSEKGLALIDRAIPVHVANEHEALESLTEDEQKTLNHLLAKLIAGLA